MKLVALLGLEKLLLVGSFLAHIYCEEQVFDIAGANVTFPVKPDKKIREAIWTKNKDKVAEWEGQGEPTYYTSLQNRGLLNKESGNLTIFNLENNDTGTYVLERIFYDGKNGFLTFSLTVLAPPSEPQISCNFSGDDLVLTCAANFKKPLNYSWKISGLPTYWGQEVLIPKESVDTGEKATCYIKYFQTIKSSEITLNQCFPSYQGYNYEKRSRTGLIVAFVLCLAFVGIVLLIHLFRKKITKCGAGGADQRNVQGKDNLLGYNSTDMEDGKNEANGGRPGNDDIAAFIQTSDTEEQETEADLSNKEITALMSTAGVDDDKTAGASTRGHEDVVEPGVAQGVEHGKC